MVIVDKSPGTRTRKRAAHRAPSARLRHVLYPMGCLDPFGSSGIDPIAWSNQLVRQFLSCIARPLGRRRMGWRFFRVQRWHLSWVSSRGLPPAADVRPLQALVSGPTGRDYGCRPLSHSGRDRRNISRPMVLLPYTPSLLGPPSCPASADPRYRRKRFGVSFSGRVGDGAPANHDFLAPCVRNFWDLVLRVGSGSATQASDRRELSSCNLCCVLGHLVPKLDRPAHSRSSGLSCSTGRGLQKRWFGRPGPVWQVFYT